MSDDRSSETAKAAWQSQRVDVPPVSITYLRSRALEHSKGTRARSVLEYLLGGTAVCMCLWFAVTLESGLFRVGVLVMLAGILYGLFEWWRRRLVWSVTLEDSVSDGLRFYKQELVRLRDLHRGFWRIYLPASLPGAGILLVWILVERSEPGNRWRLIGLTGAIVVWIVVALRHELQEANRYQRELDALDKNE